MTTTSDNPRSTAQQHAAAAGEVPSVARAAGWAFGGCVGVSLLLFLVATVGGADLDVVRSDGRTVAITPSAVVVTVMLVVLVGTLLLAFVGRRSRQAWLGVAVAGLVLGLASVVAPLTSEATAMTTFVLVAMHVACALVWFTVLTSLLRQNR